MTDTTVHTNTDNPTDLITQARAIYDAARRTGKTKIAAKRHVYDAIPGFKTAASFGTSLAPKWARAIQSVERDLALSPNGHSNGHTPTLFPVPPAAYSPTDDIVAYINHLDPAIGDTITLNLHYLAWHHGKVNDASWRFPFSPEGALARQGWRFEVISTTGRCYTVRVTDRPQTEQQRQIARLEAAINDMLRDLGRLKNGN